MKRIMVLLVCVMGAVDLCGQSLNPGWTLFRSERFGFSLEYPQSWIVNETGNGSYEFYNINKKLGLFILDIEEDYTDSAAVYSKLRDLSNEANGANLDASQGKWLLTYKTTILNEGRQYEVFHWAIGYRQRIYYCRYEIESTTKSTPDVQEEVKVAFRMIETLNLHINDED